MAQAAGSSGAAAPPAATAAQTGEPPVSQRVRDTDAPCIVATKKLVATTEGTLSLAQGAWREGGAAPARW